MEAHDQSNKNLLLKIHTSDSEPLHESFYEVETKKGTTPWILYHDKKASAVTYIIQTELCLGSQTG